MTKEDVKDMIPLDLADIDWPELIDRLGGPDAVAKALGYIEVKKRRIYQWGLRRQVPARYIAPMIALAYKAKLISSIDDLPRINPFKDPDT